MSEQALAGLKVLEFSNLVSGPYCGKMFADLGAEVIKIEEPGKGDKARSLEPFAGNVPGIERSGLFAYLNTNKMSVTLDPGTAKGKAIFLELIRDCDILIENHAPREMEDLGFTYERLEKVNPRMIMTSITPFGQTGPYRDYKAHEITTYQGCGYGFISTVTFKEPVPLPVAASGRQSEFGTGQAAAVAAMCAVQARERSGSGQQIDISIFELMAGQNEMGVTHWTLAQNVPGGVTRPLIQPVCPLPVKDGWVFIFALTEQQYDNFVKVMGNPEWTKGELFANRAVRGENVDAMTMLISEFTTQLTKQELFEKAQAGHVPLAPAYTSEEVVNDRHLAVRNYFIEIDHPVIGKALYPGAPYQLSETPWKISAGAPLLGEHNEQIYCGRLGYTKADLSRLRQAGVI